MIVNEEIDKNCISTDLIYNEYVVYDNSQVQIKYIVRIDFDFKI